MNADHFRGKWNQFKGELKKKWGAFTDDDLMKIERDYDKFKGRDKSSTNGELSYCRSCRQGVGLDPRAGERN